MDVDVVTAGDATASTSSGSSDRGRRRPRSLEAGAVVDPALAEDELPPVLSAPAVGDNVPICTVCGGQHPGTVRGIQASHLEVYKSQEFCDWTASHNRSVNLTSLARLDLQSPAGPKACSKCYNQMLKLLDQVVCGGCGECLVGGRQTPAMLRQQGWRGAQPDAIAAVREVSGYDGQVPSYLEAAQQLCGSCRAVVPRLPASGAGTTSMEGLNMAGQGETKVGQDGQDPAPPPAETWAQLVDEAKRLDEAKVVPEGRETMGLLTAKTALACKAALEKGPLLSSELFVRFVWKAYLARFPGEPSNDQARDRLKRRFNISRLLVRIRGADGQSGQIRSVSIVQGGEATGEAAVRRVVLYTSAEQLARSFVEARRAAADAGETVGAAAAVMRTEIRWWSQRHAVAAKKVDTISGFFREKPVLELLASVKEECPTLSAFLDQLAGAGAAEEKAAPKAKTANGEALPARSEYGCRDEKKAASESGPAKPSPIEVRKAFLVSMLAFAANPNASRPYHALVAAMARMDGMSEQVLTVLNRLGLTVGPRTAHRHLDKMARLGAEALASGQEINDDQWVVCALDNLDWLSKTRAYGRAAKMAHLITSILLHGSNASLPAATEESTRARPAPVLAPGQRLMHEISPEEAASFEAYRNQLGLYAVEAVEQRPSKPAAVTPTPPVHPAVPAPSPPSHIAGPPRKRAGQALPAPPPQGPLSLPLPPQGPLSPPLPPQGPLSPPLAPQGQLSPPLAPQGPLSPPLAPQGQPPSVESWPPSLLAPGTFACADGFRMPLDVMQKLPRPLPPVRGPPTQLVSPDSVEESGGRRSTRARVPAAPRAALTRQDDPMPTTPLPRPKTLAKPTIPSVTVSPTTPLAAQALFPIPPSTPGPVLAQAPVLGQVPTPAAPAASAPAPTLEVPSMLKDVRLQASIVRLHLLMDTGALVTVLVSEPATGARVREAVAHHYRHQKMQAADLKLMVDDMPWPDNALVGDMCKDGKSKLVARCPKLVLVM